MQTRYFRIRSRRDGRWQRRLAAALSCVLLGQDLAVVLAQTQASNARLTATDSPAASPAAQQSGPPPPTPSTAAPPPPVVHVNRTVPNVAAPPSAPTFSSDPTDAEFFRARIFVEPLVPVGRATTLAENRALAQALLAYAQQTNLGNVAPILAVFQTFPNSPWRASVLANIGTVFFRTGRFTRALAAWGDAWRLAKDATDPMGQAVADYALGERLELLTKVGNIAEATTMLTEIQNRDVRGSAAEKVDSARQALWVLQNRHELATPSGVIAISAWLAAKAGPNAHFEVPRELRDHHPAGHGMSLVEVRDLAQRFGLSMRMAYRPQSAQPVVPALVHLRIGHFSLLLDAREEEYLLRDVMLGDRWVSKQALDEEWSGYALVQSNTLGAGWRDVTTQEADATKGYCIVGKADPNDPGPCPTTGCGAGGLCRPGAGGPGGPSSPNGPAGAPGPGPTGMATYDFHPVSAALRLTDTPVGYTPPLGPPVMFRLTYNHRDTLLPQIPTFGNLGPKWRFDWFSYIIEYPGGSCGVYGCDVPSVTVLLRGFGSEEYGGAPSSTQDFGYHWRSRAHMVRVSRNPIRYERQLPDGSVEVFTLPNGAPEGQRVVFMTSVIDPQGNAVTLSYDAQFRIVGITDALSQVTTLSYELPGDPLKLTKVTDPFGRFARFTYTAAGQLATITDVIGLTSVFSYTLGDFVAALTTPYGKTMFRRNPSQYSQWVEATDPLGGTERLEFWLQDTTMPTSLPAASVPTGFSAYNEHLDYFNSFYWDKRAMALAPGDRTQATVTHWLINRPVQNLAPYNFLSSSIPHSIKRPLEGRVWYAYPNQDTVTPRGAGDGTMPSKTARVLDDGSSQIWQASYNVAGRPTSLADPIGRQTTFVYASNGIDIMEMRQTTGGANDLLATFSNYTAQHRPQSTANAAGQNTTFTYNTRGQVLTVTNAKNETTTYAYDPSRNGELTSVTGPVAGSTTNYTYDDYGRLRTITGSDGYALTRTYDALDRPIGLTFPDGTSEQLSYDRLDISASQDRLGRVTRFFYDAMRRVVAIRDGLGRTQSLRWCACGALLSLIDGRGQQTSWEYDLQDRLIRERRDDSTVSRYVVYEATTNRPKLITDAKGQVETRTYNLDDTLSAVAYSNATISTPPIGYTYDQAYNRVLTTTDGAGTTTYGYKPVGTLGANLLASVVGPSANYTILYSYDELGRVSQRTVNGINQSLTYDSLDRLSTETNALGMFVFGYDGTTTRVKSVAYPSGQTSIYSYFDNSRDRRLQTIHNKYPNGATLSKFDYIYDAVGNIVSWRQQLDSATPTEWTYTYDQADQLLTAVRRTVETTPTILTRRAYGYDGAGNRAVQQVDDAVTVSTFDRRNRLVSQQAGGSLRVAGIINKPAVVTIQGTPATVSSTLQFAGVTQVSSGTNSFTVVATDPNGNSRTQAYRVDVSGPTTVYGYDANGNMTSNGSETFEWDARNNLVSVTSGTHRIDFGLNGRRQQVSLTVRDSGVVSASCALVWCGTSVCEDRRSDTGAIDQRFFRFGVQRAGGSLFYAMDHLLSVREVVTTDGSLVRRDDYDPFGVRNRLVGGNELFSAGFATQTTLDSGHLSMTQLRPYDTLLGRWLSEDPIGLRDDTNLYAYVSNAPVSWIDPVGSIKLPPTPKDLPPGWKPDPTHKDPNGERWRSPDTDDFLDFHRGRSEQKGRWRGRDHWHWNGGDKHYKPGDEIPEIPDPKPPAPPRSWWSEPPEWLTPLLDPLIIIVNPCYSNPRFPGCPLSCPVPTTTKSSE